MSRLPKGPKGLRGALSDRAFEGPQRAQEWFGKDWEGRKRQSRGKRCSAMLLSCEVFQLPQKADDVGCQFGMDRNRRIFTCNLEWFYEAYTESTLTSK